MKQPVANAPAPHVSSAASSAPPASTLSWPHLLLGLAVVAVWGTNFVVIKYALAQLPPLTLAVLRFALAAFPALLLVPRPAVRWRNLAAYGVLIGLGQFGLLFLAMTRHISPGLASLVVQMQVFFTIGLAMWLTGERLRPFQWLAAAVALSGIGLIGLNAWRDGASVTPLGLALVLLAGLAWAAGNMVSRAAGRVDMLGYMVWSSAFAVPPLLALALLFEGGAAMWQGISQADWGGWAAVLWQSVGNTLFGYGAWAWLLARYPAGSVTPLALLVPVFGMSASSLLLGESMPGWKVLAALLVLSGLALNVLWPRLRARLARA